MIAGNWKMNGTGDSITDLLTELRANVDQVGQCEVVVLPSFVYLDLTTRMLQHSMIKVGAQDVDERDNGPVTGAVSASMLKDSGCQLVMVGHSERRTLFSEGDECVARKFEQCLQHNLRPILCVGEVLEERQAGVALDVVSRQLNAVFSRIEVSRLKGAVLAYEPVWAIGTGESASPDQVEEVHASLRECVRRMDSGLADSMSILYGGSVTEENASALFEKENIDGALVGGASLEAKSFIGICEAADNSVR